MQSQCIGLSSAACTTKLQDSQATAGVVAEIFVGFTPAGIAVDIKDLLQANTMQDRSLAVLGIVLPGLGDGVKALVKGGVKSADGTVDLSRIASVPTGSEFSKWFDSLTSTDFNTLWSNPEARALIERRLREPGGFHEWFMVSRVDKFKSWGMQADDIWSFRTKTDQLKWINPETGISGKHGGHGSGAFHYELGQLIDKSSSLNELYAGLVHLSIKWNIPNLPSIIRK